MLEATIAAVSTLKIFLPKVTVLKLFFNATSISVLSNPPSGPIKIFIFFTYLFSFNKLKIFLFSSLSQGKTFNVSFSFYSFSAASLNFTGLSIGIISARQL